MQIQIIHEGYAYILTSGGQCGRCDLERVCKQNNTDMCEVICIRADDNAQQAVYHHWKRKK